MCSSYKDDRWRAQSSFAAKLGLRVTPAASGPWLLSVQARCGKTKQTAVRGELADNSTAFAKRAASIRPAAVDQRQSCNQTKRRALRAKRRNVADASGELWMMQRWRFPAPGQP